MAYLNAHGMDPADYLIAKFADHDLVLLGEDHAIKEHLDFVRALIPRLHAAGVHTLAVEFGASEMQTRLDAVLNAPDYDEAAVREMLYFYNVGWAYEEYAGLCREAWKLNRTLRADQPRFRILNLSYRYDWSRFDGVRTPENMRQVFHRGTPDKFRTELIERELLAKREKALVFMGSVHAFTRYRMPVLKMNDDDFIDYDDGWVGSRLYRKHPEKVFNIMLHFPFPVKSGRDPRLLSPANGAVEAVMASRHDRPAGFDLRDSVMGDLRDDSFFSIGHPDFRLRDFFDGYIFIKPFKALTGCTVDPQFLDGKPWSEIEAQMPDADWHRAGNLEAYWRQIRDFVDIKKRYADVIQASLATPSRGRIDRYTAFPSRHVVARNVDVWLPDGYSPARRYTVVYMHDGQMLFDRSIAWNGADWRADEVVSALLDQHAIAECIVVGIWNTGALRHREYFPQKPFAALAEPDRQRLLAGALPGGPRADAYLSFLVEELKPFIDTHYSTHRDADHTVIAGSSMGGLISIYALCEYPQVFGRAACLSTHWIGLMDAGKPDTVPDAFVDYLEKRLPPPGMHRIYFDHGDVGLDGLYAPTQERVDALMRKKGYRAADWSSRVFSGKEHSEDAWSERLHIPLTFLLGVGPR
ncbi:MAG TPA: ChaN family lipoprotein [Opitutaceae bacterium]